LTEVVAIGTEARGEEDLLGRVVGMDATDHRLFILDDIFGAVRVYDTAGNHVMNIGRFGEGPGEFGAVTDLGIDPLQRHLVVREPRGTLHRFTLSGEFVDRTPFRSFMALVGPGLLLRVTREGEAIIPHVSHGDFAQALQEGRTPTRTRLLYTIAPDGTLKDSLALPMANDEPNIMKAWVNSGTYRPEPVPFAPQTVWSIGWDGSLIIGFSDEYRFEIRHPQGNTTILEREAVPVPVLAGERAWATDRVRAIMRNFDPGWTWNGPEIPAAKAWYTGIVPDRSGRIWVLREGEGRRVEGWEDPEDWRAWQDDPAWIPERWFEVFEEATGRFLGRVDVPEGFAAEPEPVIDGNRFICLTMNEFDLPVVRRYRLEVPAQMDPRKSPGERRALESGEGYLS